MKKRFFGILIILTSLILTFGYSSNISAIDLIHGVYPTKVTAHYNDDYEDYLFKFWNVGQLGGWEYETATATQTYLSGENSGKQHTYQGIFTGGPKGTFVFQSPGSLIDEWRANLVDGKHLFFQNINVVNGYTTVDNPEAFDGWYDEAEVTDPTIELKVLEDSPVTLEGGKLSWTVEALVGGKPAPTVVFSCDPGDSISATGNKNIVGITAEKGKISTLTATASNWYSTKEDVMTFVNEDSGVRFSGLGGEVEIRPDNDPTAWRNANYKDVLMVDTHIRTGNNSSAMLSFADASTFTLKPNSEVVLSTASSKDSQLKLIWGNMMLNIKKMMKDGSMQVEMSQAVSGIKGTILVLSETGTESTVKVIEGTVEFKLLDSSKSVMVNTGESVTASKDGLSKKTAFDPAEELKSWESITGQTTASDDNNNDTNNDTNVSILRQWLRINNPDSI